MANVNISPIRLPPNPWVDGFVLDRHTVSSTPTDDPYYRWDTKRTELGELLYRFKYRGDNTVLADIVDTAEQFVRKWKPPIDCIVPAPASLTRKTQPTAEIAGGIAARLHLPVFGDAVVKLKATSQMKNIDDWSERQKVLREAVQIGQVDVRGKSILLFDDLIQSGSTIQRVGEVLLGDGGARALYALVLTRTK